MVRLLIVQYASNLFSIFAQIGYKVENGDFISHESAAFVRDISDAQRTAIMHEIKDSGTIYLGNDEFPVILDETRLVIAGYGA